MNAVNDYHVALKAEVDFVQISSRWCNSSSLEEHCAVRGLEFLLDKNRKKVAISQTKTPTIVLCDPRIAGTQVTTVEQMEILNLFCKPVRETSGPAVRAR